jgi:hypothetical protein
MPNTLFADELGAALTPGLVARGVTPVPVATNCDFPFQTSVSGGLTAGSQAAYRTLHYFPKGAVRPQLVLTSANAGAGEGSNPTGYPSKIAVAIEGAPWSATKSYAVGDVVTYYATQGGGGAYGNNSQFVCLVANTGSPPSPTNTSWSAGTRPATTTVTVGGLPDASFATKALADGTTVAPGIIITDPVPLTVPVGGYLAIYSWFPCSGSQQFAVGGQSQSLALGAGLTNGTTVSDATPASAGQLLARSSAASHWTPAAIIGAPLVATPAVTIIGDSIMQGKTGANGLSGVTLNAAGTGYKVGDILTIDNQGATAGAIGAGSSAKIIVDAIGTGGAISTLRVVDPGSFTSTSSQTGQTLPSGAQNLLGGSGSGATLSAVSFNTNPFDPGDATGAQGYMKRALAAAGIPHASFTAAGDRVNLWRARSYTRLAAIAACGSPTVIIALGRNDLTAGDSLATIQANLTWLVQAVRAQGAKKVIGCTVTPETTSTTAAGQTTLADQTVTSNDSVRQLLNAWLRGGTSPFDAVIDVSAAVESGTTGKIVPIGAAATAPDGKHYGASGIAAMQAAVATAIGSGLLN